MIGYMLGRVIFSDGQETILVSSDGVGYQIHSYEILSEGSEQALFISHIFRETSQEMFGFKTLKEKKAFELLLKVKGVGPKSAYSLVQSLGFNGVVMAIRTEDKKSLQKAPGVGAKAAAQIVLDLSEKINSLQMYTHGSSVPVIETKEAVDLVVPEPNTDMISFSVLQETLMACKELGFREEQVTPVAERVMQENSVTRSEQLVHLVLKEL